MFKSLSKWVGSTLVILTLLFGTVAGHSQVVHAEHYSSWVIVSVSGVKERRILYNGMKPMIQMYQDVKYRRTYTDNSGRTTHQYKTEKRNLGLKSPYS